jgi:hypothetical protein
VSDAVGQLRRDHARLDQGDAYVREQLLAQGLRPAVQAPLGGGIDAVTGPCGAPGDRRDVEDVAAAVLGAVLELVEEDFSGRDRAEQVDLDHVPVVLTLIGREWAKQHDAGVVDQDVGAAELDLDALAVIRSRRRARGATR